MIVGNKAAGLATYIVRKCQNIVVSATIRISTHLYHSTKKMKLLLFRDFDYWARGCCVAQLIPATNAR